MACQIRSTGRIRNKDRDLKNRYLTWFEARTPVVTRYQNQMAFYQASLLRPPASTFRLRRGLRKKSPFAAASGVSPTTPDHRPENEAAIEPTESRPSTDRGQLATKTSGFSTLRDRPGHPHRALPPNSNEGALGPCSNMFTAAVASARPAS